MWYLQLQAGQMLSTWLTCSMQTCTAKNLVLNGEAHLQFESAWSHQHVPSHINMDPMPAQFQTSRFEGCRHQQAAEK